MTLKPAQLEAGARRATAWLAAQVTPMGNYRGADAVRADGTYADTDDIGCYYKSIYTLRVGGQPEAAGRCMAYLMKRFKSKEGDYYNSPEVRSSGSYGPVFCQLYQNSWLMRGAAALYWFAEARSILAFMNTQRDPEFGGYTTVVNSTTGIMDSNSIGIGAYSCILGGDIIKARQSVDLLLKMLASQKDAGILWSRCRKDGTLITDLADVPEKNHHYVRVSAKDGKQAYWIWAWPQLAMIAMYEITGERKYLDGAVKIFDFLASSHPHAFGFTTAGKDSWAAAKLYRITRDTRYLEKSMLQMHYILDHQHANGYMLGEGVADEAGQPKRTTFDYTADFTSWLIDCSAEFAAAGL